MGRTMSLNFLNHQILLFSRFSVRKYLISLKNRGQIWCEAGSVTFDKDPLHVSTFWRLGVLETSPPKKNALTPTFLGLFMFILGHGRTTARSKKTLETWPNSQISVNCLLSYDFLGCSISRGWQNRSVFGTKSPFGASVLNPPGVQQTHGQLGWNLQNGSDLGWNWRKLAEKMGESLSMEHECGRKCFL
jgi:hypothetical protein